MRVFFFILYLWYNKLLSISVMKKYSLIALSAVILISSCDTYAGAGAYAGSSLGAVLGSAIGGLAGGRYGSDVGTIVGMAGGAVVGAAVGDASDRRNEREVYADTRTSRQRSVPPQVSDDSGFDPNNSGDDRIYDFNSSDYNGDYTAAKPTINMPMQSSVENLAEGLKYIPHIEIRNARFVDANENGSISRGELCKIIFEIYNNGSAPAFDVQPSVLELTGNKHIYVSPSVHVEKIEAGKGIRYTSMVKADNRLNNGKLHFCLTVLVGNKATSKVVEFDVPTYKK